MWYTTLAPATAFAASSGRERSYGWIWAFAYFEERVETELGEWTIRRRVYLGLAVKRGSRWEAWRPEEEVITIVSDMF